MVQCHADRIKGILLIGTDGGKRKLYFERAAREAGIPVAFLDWRNLLRPEREEEPCLEPRKAAYPLGCRGQGEEPDSEEAGVGCQAGEGLWRRTEGDLRRWAVKIDAPEWESSGLMDLGKLTDRYVEWLNRLSRLPAGFFLNDPTDIAEVLDKRRCKERLVQKGVPVTHMYGESFSHSEELFAFMREHRLGQVFVKPLRGSGAAGVAALRYSPGNGRLALYTCAALEEDGIFNTKRMRRMEGREGAALLEKLLKLDCVVERWYGKETFQGYCYDLRVIVQGGQIDYILPRLSKGPITNLHLNNRSMEFTDLNLDKGTVERISEVCLKAGECYPRLKSIGMDVLLERGSRSPRVIEMNAQGDLLHKDVYGENRIYRRQIRLMTELSENIH
ncbi:hypothetical protein D7X48_12280 [bacterium D16-50]|nr:hypothetical protein D7X48_12280 [bacterium D16-50]